MQKLFNVSTFLFRKKKYLLQLRLIEWIFCFHCFSVAKNTFISIISKKINTCNILSNPVFAKWYSKASIKKSLLSCSRAKKTVPFQIIKIFAPFLARSAEIIILWWAFQPIYFLRVVLMVFPLNYFCELKGFRDDFVWKEFFLNILKAGRNIRGFTSEDLFSANRQTINLIKYEKMIPNKQLLLEDMD